MKHTITIALAALCLTFASISAANAAPLPPRCPAGQVSDGTVCIAACVSNNPQPSTCGCALGDSVRTVQAGAICQFPTCSAGTVTSTCTCPNNALPYGGMVMRTNQTCTPNMPICGRSMIGNNASCICPLKNQGTITNYQIMTTASCAAYNNAGMDNTGGNTTTGGNNTTTGGNNGGGNTTTGGGSCVAPATTVWNGGSTCTCPLANSTMSTDGKSCACLTGYSMQNNQCVLTSCPSGYHVLSGKCVQNFSCNAPAVSSAGGTACSCPQDSTVSADGHSCIPNGNCPTDGSTASRACTCTLNGLKLDAGDTCAPPANLLSCSSGSIGVGATTVTATCQVQGVARLKTSASRPLPDELKGIKVITTQKQIDAATAVSCNVIQDALNKYAPTYSRKNFTYNGDIKVMVGGYYHYCGNTW